MICVSAAVLAQDTASVTGTVTDPSGAAVPNAQVTVINPEKGVTRTAATNGSGDYLFAALPIGSYNLIVAAQGFKKYEAKGVILRVGQKARADVSLQVGATKETVEVQGENVAQVETQSSELTGTVTGKEINQLQLNGRNLPNWSRWCPESATSPGRTKGRSASKGTLTSA